MTERTTIGKLDIDPLLAEFVNDLLLPQLTIGKPDFWTGFEAIVDQFTPRNDSLLATRDSMQSQIDEWHSSRSSQAIEPAEYMQFLRAIRYLLEEGDDFSIDTENVDPEIASIAGPQLVVPVKNARFALNAANARWGSLYDALYGTDVIAQEGGAVRSQGYNPIRGRRVIHLAKEFLDQACPLLGASHSEVTAYSLINGHLLVELEQGVSTLVDADKLKGYRGKADSPSALLFVNNGLHIEICIDRESTIGSTDTAGVEDILLESAVTTIQDCEDSVAAVDAEDKVEVYRNWLGLMRGDLSETFTKQGAGLTRTLNPDREYQDLSGATFFLSGRSLQLIRNVGLLMRNSAILDKNGEPIYEGILDALITIATASIDVKKQNLLSNSRTGSIYIVKPKMHGPDEVRFTCDLFAAVEKLFMLQENTVKIGIMDEERRTTVNLKECIRAAKSRLAFINTGFLDRTGDEIHTSMHAGAMIPKAEMKSAVWIAAYENHNVDIGLACGLQGRAQIGKGMWAMPDLMAKMLKEKIAHPMSGANTAWVPSPTAAVLHAIHYHRVNVFERQREIAERTPAKLADILTIPLQTDIGTLTSTLVQFELDNNCQSILGYVVRWVDQGIGCSKVPDIHNIELMEDRATLRISSQHIANWLLHGICSEGQVLGTLQRMALIVDQQNAEDPLYIAMAADYEKSTAFQAACDLIFDGLKQPNGYTEPRLHARREQFKAERVG
ncbi:MAG: malate synthase G [Gammaproteobacteria bacterium]|nr:malate synthase G [Gammaproteobacteria bacterium]